MLNELFLSQAEEEASRSGGMPGGMPGGFFNEMGGGAPGGGPDLSGLASDPDLMEAFTVSNLLVLVLIGEIQFFIS